MEKGKKYASMKVSQTYDQVMFEKTGALYQECAKMLEGAEIVSISYRKAKNGLE